MKTISDFSKTQNYRFPMVGVYFRFGHSDSQSYMSHIERPGRAGELFVLAEFMEYKDYGVTSMPKTTRDKARNELLEILIKKHHISFHYGKNTDELLKALNLEHVYGENLKKLKSAVQELDPKGTFSSDFMNQILSIPRSCKKLVGSGS